MKKHPLEHSSLDLAFEPLEPRLLYSATIDVVLVDSGLDDQDMLASATTDADFYYVYDSSKDSTADILTAVREWSRENQSPIDSLSIISHGSSGSFQLGVDTVTTDSINAQSDVWKQLGVALARDANIYLYGCEVGADSAGQALIDQLASTTDADVFGSDDLTGAGGDWELEVASKGDEQELTNGLVTPVSAPMLKSYSGTLALSSTGWLNPTDYNGDWDGRLRDPFYQQTTDGSLAFTDGDGRIAPGDNRTGYFYEFSTDENQNGNHDTGESYLGDLVSGAEIVGIEVKIEAYKPDTWPIPSDDYLPSDLEVQISWDGGTSWTAMDTHTWNPRSGNDNTDDEHTYGAATPLWGRTWNSDDGDFDESNFRLRVFHNTGPNDAEYRGIEVDWIAVQVHYNAPAVVTGDTNGTGSEDGASITGDLNATDAEGLTDGTYFTVTTPASNGTASIDAATGAWSYQGNADYYGADSFTVTVTDDLGGTTTQVITVNTTAMTDIAADAASTSEDNAVTTFVFADNGSGADSFEGTPSVTSVTQGSNGTVTIIDAATGEIRYTPNANFNGTDTYTYTVTSGGVTETATVTVNVGSVDDPAIITGDTSGTGSEDGAAITGDLNATDVEGLTDGTYFTVSTPASNGTASIDAATGAWSYQANADYYGADSFTVTVTDDLGGTTTQVITVNTTAVADIAADAVSTSEDNAVITFVFADNGSGADSFEGTPSVTSVTQGSNGTVTIIDAATGEIRYTPNANFNGTDTYTYTVTSGGVTETATVTVTIDAITDLTANDDTLSVNEDSGANAGNVSVNDNTLSGGALSFADNADASHGTVVMASDGSYTYTPDANFHGADSFTYTVTDADSGENLTRTVYITVFPITDLSASDDNLTVNEDSGSNVGNVSLNDSTLSGGALSFADNADASHGTVVMASDGSYTYTPDTNFHGTDSFTYTVTDADSGESLTRTVYIAVTPVNDAPSLTGDLTANIDEGTTYILQPSDLGYTDVDDGNEDVTFTISNLINGSIQINGISTATFTGADLAAGVVTFVHDGSETPSASFDVNVDDGDEDGSSPTNQAFNFTVNSVNDAPIADNDTLLDGLEDSTSGVLNTGMLAGDTDAEGDALSITHINGIALTGGAQTIAVTNGTVDIAANNDITFTPSADYAGNVSFTYTIEDIHGASATATVSGTIANVNDAPVATDAGTATDQNSILNSRVPTATDVDGNLNSSGYVLINGLTPGQGILTFNDDGSYQFDPNGDFDTLNEGESRDIHFRYLALDNDGVASAIRTITITVNGINDAPTNSGLEIQRLWQAFSEYTIDLNALFTDLETSWDQMVYSVHGNSNIIVTIDNQGIATISSNISWNGTESISFTARDANGLTSTISTDFIVSPIPEPESPSQIPVQGGNNIDNEVSDVTDSENDEVIHPSIPDSGDHSKSSNSNETVSEGSDSPLELGDFLDDQSRTIDGIMALREANNTYYHSGEVNIMEAQSTSSGIEWLKEQIIERLNRVIVTSNSFEDTEFYRRNEWLWNQSNDSNQSLRKDQQTEELIVQAAKTAGGVSMAVLGLWLGRAAALGSTLFTAIPAWRSFDPIAVLNKKKKTKRKQQAEENDSNVEHLFSDKRKPN